MSKAEMTPLERIEQELEAMPAVLEDLGLTETQQIAALKPLIRVKQAVYDLACERGIEHAKVEKIAH